MPLYYILSGLFFKEYEGFLGFLKRKINKLIIPFLFFYVILSWLLPNIARSVLGIQGGGTLQTGWLNSFLAFFYNYRYPNEAIWFLLSLFETNIMFYIIKVISLRIIAKFRTFFIIFVSSIIGITGWFLCHSGIAFPLHICPSMASLPFFCLGYILYRKTNLLNPNKFDKYNLLFVILCFVYIYYFSYPIQLIKNDLGPIGNFYTCGIAGTIFILLLAKIIGYLPFVSNWGRYSIMILVTHELYMKIPVAVVNKMHLSVEEGCILCLILTMFSYELIIPIMKRYLPHVTAQKDIIKII